jgi:tripartite-type tricarboxylate transporter receptor subunit TctC
VKKVTAAIFCLIFTMAAFPCWSLDEYPTKAIQLICPFAPGGNSDLSARIVGSKLSEILRQPIVVMNKPGGGSSIGINYVAGSKPDGYTLLTASAGMVLIPMITPQLPYKMDDLTPIGRLVTWNNIMVVHKDTPANNLQEFIAYARKNPGALSYSSSGIGNTSHFIGELINMEAKLDLQHIPYTGENPANTAVLGKHAHVTYTSLPGTQEHVRSGALKALAVFATQRDPALPQVPTAAEQGFPGLIASSYHAFFAPAKIPPAILKNLEVSLEKVLQDKQVMKEIETQRLTVAYLNSKDTKQFLENELKKWSIIAKKAKIVVN